MPKEEKPSSYHTIVIECFDSGSMRVRLDNGHVSGHRESSYPPSGATLVTPSTAANQIEQLATALAKTFRMQDGAGVHRG